MAMEDTIVCATNTHNILLCYMYESLQDQSTLVPITVHMIWHCSMMTVPHNMYQLVPAVQPSTVVVYIDSDGCN